jgi:hypothetical protein
VTCNAVLPGWVRTDGWRSRAGCGATGITVNEVRSAPAVPPGRVLGRRGRGDDRVPASREAGGVSSEAITVALGGVC